MAVRGKLFGTRVGPDDLFYLPVITPGSVSTNAMAALNSGWAVRFTAQDTRDVLSVWLNWSTVSAAGTVQVRIETIDATTGKPTGTLYDANASVNITPVAGWQQATFASAPTTGLVVGTEYAVVLLTTVAGTTQTLRSHHASNVFSVLPSILLTAADGTTRSNFAEVNNAIPIYTLAFSDGGEETQGSSCVGGGTFAVYGARAFGIKFTLNAPLTVAAYLINAHRTGTLWKNLRARIFDATNALVAGSTATADRRSLTAINAASARRLRFWLPTPVTLPAGTYRMVIDQDDHTTTASEPYQIYYASHRAAALAPSGCSRTDTTNIDAGPITWTDTPADVPLCWLVLDDLPVAASGIAHILGGG